MMAQMNLIQIICDARNQKMSIEDMIKSYENTIIYMKKVSEMIDEKPKISSPFFHFQKDQRVQIIDNFMKTNDGKIPSFNDVIIELLHCWNENSKTDEFKIYFEQNQQEKNKYEKWNFEYEKVLVQSIFS